MPRFFFVVLLFQLLWLCVLFGCGHGGKSCPSGQGSPRAVIGKAQTAMVNHNRQDFLECFMGSDKSGQELDFEMREACDAMQEKVIQAYGTKAWEEYDKGSGIHVQSPPKDRAWVEQAKIEQVKTGVAIVTFPPPWTRSPPLRVIEKDGCWWIDADYPPIGDEEMQKRKATVIAATQEVRDVLPLLGQKGFTFDKFKKVMNEKGKKLLGITSPY